MRASSSTAISTRPILIAFLDRGDEMLAPVLDPFQRSLQQLRRRGHRDILGIDAELGAEAAADIGRRHAQPVLVDAEIGAEILVEIVRLLGRGPDRDAVARRLVLRDDAARLDRMARAAMLQQLLAVDVLGRPERRVRVAIRHAVRGDDVRGKIAPRRARTRRAPRRGDRSPREGSRSRHRSARPRPPRHSGCAPRPARPARRRTRPRRR